MTAGPTLAPPSALEQCWEPADHAFPVAELDAFCVWAAAKGASDISFQTGAAAMVEVDGRLLQATHGTLDGVALSAIAERINGPASDSILRSGVPVDCSHTVRLTRTRSLRLRVNMAPVHVDDAFGINITMRVLPDRIPTLAELAIEAEIVEAFERCQGLVLVTGVPGSGKSTLLAAGTRHLLENGAGRIHAYEAPIEFVFDSIEASGALMSSSEIPRHVRSFAEGLRASLRRRPSAVIVGEARDRETVEAVVRAADFGIAVFTTAHTIGVAATIRRLLAEFAVLERAERGAALIDQAALVVTQCLFPSPAGGRTAIREWLTFTPALKAELLERPQESWPGRIEAELRQTGNDLEAAAAAAFERGRLFEADLRRVRASTARSAP